MISRVDVKKEGKIVCVSGFCGSGKTTHILENFISDDTIYITNEMKMKVEDVRRRISELNPGMSYDNLIILSSNINTKLMDLVYDVLPLISDGKPILIMDGGFTQDKIDFLYKKLHKRIHNLIYSKNINRMHLTYLRSS